MRVGQLAAHPLHRAKVLAHDGYGCGWKAIGDEFFNMLGSLFVLLKLGDDFALLRTRGAWVDRISSAVVHSHILARP